MSRNWRQGTDGREKVGISVSDMYKGNKWRSLILCFHFQTKFQTSCRAEVTRYAPGLAGAKPSRTRKGEKRPEVPIVTPSLLAFDENTEGLKLPSSVATIVKPLASESLLLPFPVTHIANVSLSLSFPERYIDRSHAISPDSELSAPPARTTTPRSQHPGNQSREITAP